MFNNLFSRIKQPLILASGSSGRAKILQDSGVQFVVDPANIDEEQYRANTVNELVKLLAIEKAKVVVARHPNAFVLAADTLIVDPSTQPESIIGKPRDAAHAKDILMQLSGKTHKVLTGLCLYNPLSQNETNYQIGCETTLVTFKKLTNTEINDYIKSGEPIGKSGAYAIQGLASLFVDRIDGNEDNVVGLPMTLLAEMLNNID